MAFVPLNQPPEGADEHDESALVVAVHERSTVLVVDDRPPPGGLYLGSLDGRACWAIDVAGEDDVDTARFIDLFTLYGTVDETTWLVAGRAVQLVDWARNHRFCGRCATATEPVRAERAMRCPACGLLAFPRLAPAVITLVDDGDGRVLLGRNRGFAVPMFSLLAGFVEPGENLEQAAAREVLEEVGVAVRDLRYWGSQPWPFPHSLMLGFRARADVDAPLLLQADEIAEAGWFRYDELPSTPPHISIAGRMIDAWVAEQRGGASLGGT